MFTAAKRGLTILMKSVKQKQSIENIWRRNIDKDTTNKLSSDIF